MEELEQELRDFIGRELHELAWRCSYPIHPSIALEGFFESFRQHGVAVVLDGKRRTAHFNIMASVRGDSELFETSLTYYEILSGWNQRPKCSPHTLYDSVCLVFDKIEEQLRDLNHPYSHNEAREKWSKVRRKEPSAIERKMEAIWLPYFIKHHEHMILPTSGGIPELDEPRIFPRVLNKFPIHILRNAEIMRQFDDDPLCGPCAEWIPEMDFSQFNEDYHPSPSAMDSYFWGMYMNELSKEKGYPLRDNRNRLRSLIAQHESAFKHGESITWRYPKLVK